MSSKSCDRNRSAHSPPSAAASRQSRFDPLRSMVTKRRTPATAPQRKQQTLTQIDFVPRSSHRDTDDALEYLEADTPQPRRKRRKTTHGTPALARDNTLTQLNFVSRQTPSHADGLGTGDLEYLPQDDPPELGEDLAADAIMARRPPNNGRRGPKRVQVYEDQEYNPHKQRKSTRKRHLPESIPPPSTPKKLIKREIASSQSPEASPLSTQSPVKDRSPLKAVSTNQRMPGRTMAKPSTVSPMKSQRPALIKVEDTFEPSVGSELSTQRSSSGILSRQASKIVKLEIEDSEEEPDFDDDDDLNAPSSVFASLADNALVPCPQTSQAKLLDDDRQVPDTSSSLTSLPSSDPPLPSHLPSDVKIDHQAIEPEPDPERLPPHGTEHIEGHEPVNLPEVISLSSDDEPILPQPKQESNTAQNQVPRQQLLSDLDTTLPALSKVPSFGRSDSAQASAQLLGDLSRSTQSRRLKDMIAETESRPRDAGGSVHSSASTKDLSSDAGLPAEDGTGSHNDDQAVPVHIPTSQATTVDLTQPTQRTPRAQRSSGKTAPTSVTDRGPLSTVRRIQRSPLKEYSGNTIIPSSSSPIASRLAASKAVAEDRKRLTDSQLLPDSIMNFELPPLSSQDSLREEH